MQLFIFLAFLNAIVILVLTFQNPNDISLKVGYWTVSQPLYVVLLIPFAAGLIAGMSLFFSPWWRKAKLARSQKKRISELESEVERATAPVEESEPQGQEEGSQETETQERV